MTEETVFPVLDDTDLSGKHRVAKDLFSGTVGGVAQVLVGQPFDTTKVRLQSDINNQYSGALDVVKKLLRNEGPLAFYKGTLTPLLGIGACVSVQFGTNEFMKRRVFGNKKVLSEWQYYVCGAAGGLANSVLASPIEHVRIRLQTQVTGSGLYKGPWSVITKIYNQYGVTRGLMKGFVPTAIREAHGIGIYFATFEALVKNDILQNHIERKEIPGLRLCFYGACAGYSMWLTSYPIDVIKSKLQTDNLADPKYKGTIDCFRKTLKLEGPKALFKGFLPTILRAAPANAVTFYAFELTMRLLE